jgi:medium-chain acyl-[acyl-carrier-protein] hydrolase
MKQAIWTQSQAITSYLVDFQRCLSLPGLLALFQEMAWNHAEHSEHGYSVITEHSHAWVLARQRIEVQRWPTWNETVELRTWLRPPRGLLVFRDFEIVGCARGVGTWMSIDLVSRQPRAPQLGLANFRYDGHHPFQPARIEPFAVAAGSARFPVRPGDLDLNGHVNNLSYARWVLDSLALEVHRQNVLGSYEVNFLAEVCEGDVVVVQHGDQGRFQGWRESDRKVVFTAQLASSSSASSSSSS